MWKQQISIKLNLRAYRILLRLCPESKDQYYFEYSKWERMQMHIDYLMRLEMLRKGRFFILFQDYFNSMSFWGLSTDLPMKEFLSYLNIERAKKKILTLEWKSKGSIIPIPLVEKGDQTFVSAEFLYLGSYLFSPPNEQDPIFDEDRKHFNQVAQTALPELLNIIFLLPKLPGEIRELIRIYSRRLFDYTPVD